MSLCICLGNWELVTHMHLRQGCIMLRRVVYDVRQQLAWCRFERAHKHFALNSHKGTNSRKLRGSRQESRDSVLVQQVADSCVFVGFLHTLHNVIIIDRELAINRAHTHTHLCAPCVAYDLRYRLVVYVASEHNHNKHIP